MVHYTVSLDAGPFAYARLRLQRPRHESSDRWKHFHARNSGVLWQEGYFDHRLRDDERGEQLSMKVDYIRANPVAAGLSTRPEDWPWVLDSLA
jgi:REP element-mobilizing transposase RayT